MKTAVLLFFFGLKSLFCSAQSDPTFNQIERIRTQLLSDPEVARQMIDQLLAEKHTMHDTIFLHAMMLKGSYFQAVQQTTRAREVYASILGKAGAYPQLKGRIYVSMGSVKCKEGAYPEAFAYYDKALRVFRQIEDEIGMAQVYGEMGMAYNLQFQYEHALQHLRMSVEIYMAKNRYDLIAPLRQRLASTYMAKGDYAFAKEIIAKTLDDFKKAGSDRNYFATLINYAECMYFLGESAQARPVLNEAIRGLTKFEEHGYIGVSFAILGRIAADESDYNSAQDYFSKALVHVIKDNSPSIAPLSLEFIEMLQQIGRKAQAQQTIALVKPYFNRPDVSTESKARFQMVLAQTAKSANRPHEAYAAYERALQLKDSVLSEQTNKTTATLQAYYRDRWQQNKIASLQSENAELNQANNEASKAVYITLGVLAGVVFTASWMILSGKHRRRAGVRAARARITARMRSAEEIKNQSA